MMASGSGLNKARRSVRTDDVTTIEVAIGPGGAPSSFRVEVVNSPAGEASVIVELDVGALLARRAELQLAVLASAVSARGLLPETERPVREVGQALFTALLGSGEVAGRYRASAAIAAERRQGLRVVLRIGTGELASLPWEAMFDQAAGTYVCRHEQLVRRVPVPSVPAPLAVRPPLRILGVISAPRGLPALDVGQERELLARALSGPVAAGLAHLSWADTATWAELQDRLLGGQWHVLHFIGHGRFDYGQDEGVLALTGQDGRTDWVQAHRFADLLRQARPMPGLVVLNSCSGAVTGVSDLFSGVAAALVRGGVSAAAAMQYEISDTAAMVFARGFYSAIAHGRGIDEAVSSGRIAILGISGRSLEWVTPVLYLQGDGSQLFSLPGGAAARSTFGRRASRDPSEAGGQAVLTGAGRTRAADRQLPGARPKRQESAMPGAAGGTYSRGRRRVRMAGISGAVVAVLAATIASIYFVSPPSAGHALRAATPGAPIIVGSRPDWIAIAPDGKTAYVTNAGNDTVTPINLATHTPGAPIPVGKQPFGIAITPNGKFAYVTNFGGGTVTPIDLTTDTPSIPIQVGDHPYRIAITPDGKTAYVTNQADGTVTAIDLTAGLSSPPIAVRNAPQAIVITPTGKTAYVANQSTDTITPISIPGNVTGAPIKVGYYPDGITIAPDGKTAYTTDNGLETITAVDLADGQAGATIVVNSPIAIAITPNGKTAYIANYAAGTVTPMSLPGDVLGTPIKVGKHPDAIVITPNGKTAYVTDNGDGTVTPITLPASGPGRSFGPARPAAVLSPVAVADVVAVWLRSGR
jgi:YVTN family beta-propeller protein